MIFFCTLISTVEVGDHIFHVCEVNDILYNETETQVYAWNGYSEIAPLGIDPFNCSMEQAFGAFSKKALGINADNCYVYNIQKNKAI